ncbi:MAG TPA: 6-bladed beta-propeller, partial [Tepidisphaeraceae bacterium]|nr:6-bladed beta-propeller [Tepidisphaeraceae bacterium]
VGLALRRVDANLQQQAVMDGAYWRVTARQLAGPMAASLAIVLVLAMQEFAVYEPTGISVVATEVRMVFDTGAMGGTPAAITAPVAGGGTAGGGDAQAANAAAAVATAGPVLLIVAGLSAAALAGARAVSATDDVDAGAWPGVLDAGWGVKLLAVAVVLLTVAVPVVALVLSHRTPRPIGFVWAEFSPQVMGTLFVGSIVGAIAFVLALAQAAGRARGAVWVAVAAFLVGGQFVAIGLIRVYNRPALASLYDSAAVVVMAHCGRFAWLAALAGAAAWGRPWRAVRDLAAVDGASLWQTAARVVWPLAWPTLLAAAVLVGVLSLGEVPATVLLAPQDPPMLVPALMTWVHTLRFDPMIEGALLMAGMTFGLGVLAALLVVLFRTRMLTAEARMANDRQRPLFTSTFALLTSTFLLLPGCSRSDAPDDTWLTTGTAPGQTIYPRGIAYSAASDEFYVVDRMARIQRLDAAGRALNGWQMPDWERGKPVGLTVGPGDELWVPDTHYHRVKVYDKHGRELRTFGSEGRGPGQFIYPTDVAFDDRGRVFVSEYGDHDRVQVFTRDGTYLFEFGAFGSADGEFSRPQSIAIRDERVYVADSCNHRINVFTTDGQFVRNMGTVGDGPGQFRFPFGLDFDRAGRLVVCEFGNNRVQQIDPATGKGLATWGRGGREPGELAYPWGVAVDKRGRIVAVDAGNNRLQVFKF